MRESSKVALGGIVAALAVVIMMITYISPLLVYTAPPFAGILLIIIIEEIGCGCAFGTYVAISLLSVFLIADKEAAVFFTLFFGYYPILRTILTKHIKIRPILYIIKLVIFNLSLAGSVFICSYVFNIDYTESGSVGQGMFLSFWLLMNAVFVCYDFLLSKILLIYNAKLKKEILKLLHR